MKVLSTLPVVALAIAILGWPGTASTNQQPSDPALLALDRAIETVVREHDVPSVAYALLRPGNSPHMVVLGQASRNPDRPATTRTRYRIASISKMLVGIAIMQLVESGDLSLSDPVSELAPNIVFYNKWAESHPVRLVHLLENTTGWDEISLAEFAYNNYPTLTLAESLAINPGARSSRWQPGTRHAYTNSAAAVAAHIVESKTGMRFDNYVQQRIFDPLGMFDATYAEANTGSEAATAYQRGKPVPYKHLLMGPAGSVSASLEDMTRLTQLYLNEGAPLLSSASVARMEQSESTNAGPFPAGYGLTNYARYYDGWRYRGHDGALPGWLSELSYSPDQKVGFVVLQNSEKGQAFRRIVTLISEFLNAEFEMPDLQPVSVPSQWQARSGYYRYLNPRNSRQYFLERLAAVYSMSVGVERAELRSLFPPGWSRTLFYDQNGIWRSNKGEQVLVSAADPLAGQVLHYGDRVFKKVSAINAWADKGVLVAWLFCLVPAALYSVVWPIRKLRGKIASPSALRGHALTTAATASAFVFLIFLGTGLASPIDRLGKVSLVSVGVMFSSVLLALITAWACWEHYRLRGTHIGPLLYHYRSLFLVLQVAVVVYLGWFGVIGIQTWA